MLCVGWRCRAVPFRAQPSAPCSTTQARALGRPRPRPGLEFVQDGGDVGPNREPGAVFSKASCKGQRAPKKDEFQGDLGSRPGAGVPRMRLTDVLAETPGKSPASRPRAAAGRGCDHKGPAGLRPQELPEKTQERAARTREWSQPSAGAGAMPEGGLPGGPACLRGSGRGPAHRCSLPLHPFQPQ